MAKSNVQRAIRFSIDRLGYENLKPEQETVVREFLGGKNAFAALPTGYGKSLCYWPCFPQALAVSASEPLPSIQTGLSAYIAKQFQTSHYRKQKLSICLFSMVMFFQEADQNRYQRSDSIAAVLILRLPLASMIAVPQQPQVVAGSDHCH